MHKSIILGLTILLLTVAEFNAAIFVPSMPAMMEALNASMMQVQLMVVVAMIAFGVALFAWGPLSDRMGRRFVVLMGLGLYFIGSVMISAVTEMPLLIVGRVLQGLGISCAGAILPVIPKDIFSGKALTRAFSVISMAFAIMPMISQVLGGYLQTYYGWRSTFFFLCGYSALIWLILFKFLPETNKNIPLQKGTSLPIIGQYWDVLKDSAFLGYLACMSFIFAGEMAYIMVTPFLLQNDLGISAVAHGWLSLCTGGGLLCGALLSAKLASSRNTPQLVWLGIKVAMAATGVMGAAVWLNYLTVPVLVAPMVLFMVGAGLVYPNCIAGIMNRFPEKSGVAGSLMSSFQMIGAGAFAALMADLNIHSQSDLCLAFVAVVTCTMLAYAWFIRGK